MFHIFLELVKRVGIFVIIGQTVLHFGIGKEYEKYMRFVVSLMVAAQVVFAFHSYLKKEETDTWIVSTEQYYERWNKNMKELEEEFLGRQTQLEENLEQRFQGSLKMELKEKGTDINEIKIEKIVIQE